MKANTYEIMDRGMNCLLEHLGTIETEQFISVLLRERFDYTRWRRQLFDGMSLKEVNEEAVRYAKEHPFAPKKEQAHQRV